MAALGEFVLVADGRCGVLVVPPQTRADVLALWFGELVDDAPVVELVESTAVRRVESTEVPGYYH
jgi:hypothetical protein